MCDYCNATLYNKAQRIMHPVLAPLPRAAALMDEYISITGEKFAPIEKKFCPVCGRTFEEEH